MKNFYNDSQTDCYLTINKIKADPVIDLLHPPTLLLYAYTHPYATHAQMCVTVSTLHGLPNKCGVWTTYVSIYTNMPEVFQRSIFNIHQPLLFN